MHSELYKASHSPVVCNRFTVYKVRPVAPDQATSAMKGFIIASICLVLATTFAHGTPVGSCVTFSGKGAVTFLRDDRNCSVFYECVSTLPTKRACPNGLHFNAVLKVCDWPAASGCAVAPTSVNTFKNEPVPIDAIPVMPLVPIDCPAVGGCPKMDVGGNLVIQLPHAFNCSRFCKCDHGRAVTFECPTGLHYNKAGGFCDWPVNAMCMPDRGFAANWS